MLSLLGSAVENNFELFEYNAGSYFLTASVC